MSRLHRVTKRLAGSLLTVLLAWLLLPAAATAQGSQDAASDIPRFPVFP